MILIFFTYFFSNGHLSGFLLKSWESKIVQLNDDIVYDYGVLPGGFSYYYKTFNRFQLNSSGDRLFQTIDLYKEGKIKKIIISGGSGNLLNKDIQESVFVKEYLLKIGIDSSDVLVESKSRNTFENAFFVKEKYGETDKQYLLITSAFHMKRALACFKKQKLNVSPYPVGFMSNIEHEKGRFLKGFIPQSSNISTWAMLLKEWIGMTGYKMRGYV